MCLTGSDGKTVREEICRIVSLRKAFTSVNFVVSFVANFVDVEEKTKSEMKIGTKTKIDKARDKGPASRGFKTSKGSGAARTMHIVTCQVSS